MLCELTVVSSGVDSALPAHVQGVACIGLYPHTAYNVILDTVGRDVLYPQTVSGIRILEVACIAYPYTGGLCVSGILNTKRCCIRKVSEYPCVTRTRACGGAGHALEAP